MGLFFNKLFKNIAAIIEEPCEPPTLAKSVTLEKYISKLLVE